MNYTISLYDKDMDCYLDILCTSNKDKAITVCKAVYNLIKNAYVLNKGHRTSAILTDIAAFPYEQFDWVQVFDNAGECIFVNNEKYKK